MKIGNALYKHCRGEDDRELNFGHERKSVSAEVNYGIRFTQYDEVDKFLQQLSSEVVMRLKAVKSRGRCITLKLMVNSSYEKYRIHYCNLLVAYIPSVCC